MSDTALNNLTERNYAAALREERQDSAGEAENSGGGEGSLRERTRRAINLKERAKEKVKEKVLTPMKEGTNWLLRWAWGVAVPSFGLSLIYVNTHLFLRQIFPDAFCKLGEEWMPKTTFGDNSATNVAGTAFGIFEIIGLLIVDLLLIFIIISALAIFAAIISFWDAGSWDKTLAIWNAIGTLGWSAVQALIDLFDF